MLQELRLPAGRKDFKHCVRADKSVRAGWGGGWGLLCAKAETGDGVTGWNRPSIFN